MLGIPVRASCTSERPRQCNHYKQAFALHPLLGRLIPGPLKTKKSQYTSFVKDWLSQVPECKSNQRFSVEADGLQSNRSLVIEADYGLGCV